MDRNTESTSADPVDLGDARVETRGQNIGHTSDEDRVKLPMGMSDD